MDLAIEVTSGQLVDVGQVSNALDVVSDEPGSMLSSIRDVLLLLLISSHFLLASTWALRSSLLIRHVFGVAML